MENIDQAVAGSANEGERSWSSGKLAVFAFTIITVVLFDFITKQMVQQRFHLYEQVPVIGDYLRLTFIYNPGAAFGIRLGQYSRQIFLVLSVIALIGLTVMYWSTPVRDRVRLMAISLICAGAIGNLIDRIRSHRGVIDFLDVGIGDLRWPVFNIADIAVTTGAVFLALSLWREEKRDAEQREQLEA